MQAENNNLQLQRDSCDISHAEVAEMSRPNRAFNEALREPLTKKSCGRKRVNKPVRSSRTNWFQPALWTMILEAGQDSGSKMRPTVIQRTLQSRSALFRGISSQWIGRKITTVNGRRCWTEKALWSAELGNSASGKSTRAGILVSIMIVHRLTTRKLTTHDRHRSLICWTAS